MHFTHARWLRRAVALASLVALAPLVIAQSTTPTPVPATGEPAQAATSGPATPPPEPASDETSSYSIGLVFGNQLHSAGVSQTLSMDAVMRGLKDGVAGKSMTDEDRQRAVQMVRASRDRVAEHNHAVAKDFLTKNSAAPGITTTNSGLQYAIIAPGDAKAASPAATDRVTVHYRGRLLDGTEFDSSETHAQAATFNVSGVIKGWHEALLLMKPGAKWRLFVPPELAYDLNSPPTIPPGSLLIFDVELVKVEPPPVMSGQGAKGSPDAKASAPKAPGAKYPVSKPAASPAPGQ